MKTCALTAFSRHLVNAEALALAKPGLRVVNVGRGPVIDEPALEAALETGQVYSAALDVFEVEPLPAASSLRQHPRCVFGSHNASNTADAVARTSEIAISKLAGFLAEASLSIP
ncbi:Glyoxylate/hydroxypyruvate reductase B [Thiorhodovibrio winogradskyi]|uniref:Glyoxylate/hydroxypyruvate reductase B n=1 Tax=Thiorhodovibrio winogradskyi TaxID=77007 RepID=A0ABZ0S1Q2_9GAMM|nr:NAD(P)-dependent oxidoreductase [Thiorhodovibrio winogradskyi]